MKDRKSFAILIMSLTATILLMANSDTARRAIGYSVKDRDYQVVTANAVAGGQALFISDNRTGQVAVFTWDPAAKTLIVRDRHALSDLFSGK